MKKYLRLTNFILLLLFVTSVVFDECFALTPQERALLEELKEKDLGIPALWGVELSDKDIKGSKFFAGLRAKYAQESTECEALKKCLNDYCLSLDQLTIALVQSDFAFPGYFFWEEGVKTTCYANSRESLSLSIRHKDLIDCQLCSDEETHPSVDQVFFRFLSDPLKFPEYLRYFEYDVVFLSKFFDDTSQIPSFNELKKFLSSLSSKAPFTVLSIPKTCTLKGAGAFLDNPSILFAIPTQVKITELKLPKDHPRRVLFVQKMGVSIESQTFVGEPLSYRPKFGRFIWVNPDLYIKQYQQKGAIFYNLIKCSRTLDFYERATKHKLKFVPKLILSVLNEDFGYIVIKNEGISLKEYLEDQSDEVQKKTLDSLLDCFVTLEELGINPFDLKVENVVVNQKGQVFLIDYDNAKINIVPTLPEFLCILWGLANGRSKGRFTSRTFVEEYKKYPVEGYGPSLKRYVEPILKGKVTTFAELKALLASK